jgi:uncharacterized pyridoxamine 5'-phosphate oxidase family protein
MDLDFDAAYGEVMENFESSDYAVLATSAQDRVSARTVSYVVEGGRLYFQTDRNFEKYRQIAENGNIALCLGAMQVQGVAKILGRALGGNTARIAGLLRMKHPDGLSVLYSRKADEIELVEITPVFVKIWSERGGVPAVEFIDVANRTASRTPYE